MKTVKPSSPITPGTGSGSQWYLQANQSDHGETSVICTSSGFEVCSIQSPVWDEKAPLKHPEDAANARMLVSAQRMFGALREAEKALAGITKTGGQKTKKPEASAMTHALRVVREAIRSAKPPRGIIASFRVAVNVELRGTGIAAYDNEAAQRYARESLEKMRGTLDNAEVYLGFADGEDRGALFSLPSHIEVAAVLTGGREGDPDNTMEHGVFDVTAHATVEFDIEAPATASRAKVIARAQELLSQALFIDGVAFGGKCFGTMKPSLPLRIDLVKDV